MDAAAVIAADLYLFLAGNGALLVSVGRGLYEKQSDGYV